VHAHRPPEPAVTATRRCSSPRRQLQRPGQSAASSAAASLLAGGPAAALLPLAASAEAPRRRARRAVRQQPSRRQCAPPQSGGLSSAADAIAGAGVAGGVLEAHGYNRHGDEIMYNGITGEQMPCDIFIGPTYYLRLKHMVADKINYRARGKMVGLTHQPPKGRGNDGGLRIGEMETNAIIAHGIGGFAKESMMERSDGFQVGVQDLAGAPSQKKINIPYSMKLLSQELMGLSIDPRFCFDSDGESRDGYGDGDGEEEEDGEGEVESD
jgi:hypothetical protein